MDKSRTKIHKQEQPFSIERSTNWFTALLDWFSHRKGKPIFPIEYYVEQIIYGLYILSPYKWVDDRLKKEQTAVNRESLEWDRIRHRRYAFSELYITGWFGISVLLLIINNYISTHQVLILPLVVLIIFRIIGILNKELGVTLFGICKITEGRNVSSSSRVILLALCNYFTSGLLFAFIYSKVGVYKIGEIGTVSGLPTNCAILQALSLQFLLSPTYVAVDSLARLLMIFQSAFCLLFGIIIVSIYISLLRINTEFNK